MQELTISATGKEDVSPQVFFKNLARICQSHIDRDRAHRFGFLSYSNNDKGMRKVIKHGVVQEKLNQLLGNDMTLFYIKETTSPGHDNFVMTFCRLLAGSTADMYPQPFLVLFSIESAEVVQVQFFQLNSDIFTSFHDIFSLIQTYGPKRETKNSIVPSIVKEVGKAALNTALETLSHTVFGLG